MILTGASSDVRPQGPVVCFGQSREEYGFRTPGTGKTSTSPSRKCGNRWKRWVFSISRRLRQVRNGSCKRILA